MLAVDIWTRCLLYSQSTSKSPRKRGFGLTASIVISTRVFFQLKNGQNHLVAMGDCP
ncbi:hypothetical protein RBSH_02725 [Rhodopirellula baltica SH28]|uniref:Uncharacterized protein n=1 Tax=Rhodopirellula baltica SH28 TaxID=993517 RepID=K5DGK2_RHOBT|nr:hypothetical protein RBSH_02725 [Rhodopirellula baltica SH28]